MNREKEGSKRRGDLIAAQMTNRLSRTWRQVQPMMRRCDPERRGGCITKIVKSQNARFAEQNAVHTTVRMPKTTGRDERMFKLVRYDER